MSSIERETQEQKRLRRQRINRIKSAIVFTIVFWMIFSFLAIIILSVQVVRLNRRLNLIVESQRDPEDSQKSDVGVSNNLNGGQDSSRYPNVITGIDSPDNFASATDSHQVYLTFDCIPGENTNRILDVLKQYQIKATFFVSGDDSEEAKEVYRRIVDEGHTLGMHSYSNQYNKIYASTDAFREDYRQLSDYLYETTDVRCRYYRFPGGSGNEISNVNMAEFVHILNEEQVIYFDWNVSAGDAAADYTVSDIVDNVVAGVSKYKTSVVLLHDDADKSTTAEAVGPLIDALQGMQTQLLPIDENTNVIQYIKADSVG